MAEYLAHVHQESFDGVLFKSVQRAEGINVVLFNDRHDRRTSGQSRFALDYVDGSFKLFSTTGIQYKHTERDLVKHKGKVTLLHEDFLDDDDEW
jgi:RES domain